MLLLRLTWCRKVAGNKYKGVVDGKYWENKHIKILGCKSCREKNIRKN